MTYGYGDDASQGRTARRPDESDEAYQARTDPRTGGRYAPHNYDSTQAGSYPQASTGRPASGYPASGYGPTSAHPGDYQHTEAPGHGAQGGYGQTGQGQGGYGQGGYGQTGQVSAYPTDGPYPPQPAGPYPPQPAYGQTGTYARTRDDETAYGHGAYAAPPGPRSPQPSGYGPGRGATTHPPQQYGGQPTGYPPPYQPQSYQPQPGQTGTFRAGAPQTGTFQPPAYGQRGYPAPQQRLDDSGNVSRRMRGDAYGEVDLDQPEPPRRRSKRGVIITLVVLVLLVAGGFGAKMLLSGGNDSGAAAATAKVNKPTDEQAKRVASQKVDDKPLTADEVFGAGTIASNAQGGGNYKVVKSQEATDCKSAVGGDIATALSSAGCTQVVRATMTSPDGSYVITAGIFNLSDSAKADAAQSAIRTAIDGHKGRFNGFPAGGATDVVAQAAANVAWDARGHFLMYCVIVLADGKAISADDKRTAVIVNDVVESYLGGTVIHARELGSANPTASSGS